jgi:hypothetical protein
MTDIKPLNWVPKPGVGYTVARRADGGMTLVFTDLSDSTLADWREFAFEHLFNSDRLTRNLYDLRQVADIPEKAIKAAVEVNNDPSTRNLRVAVVVANEKTREAVIKIASGATGAGAAIRVFADLAEAEAWVSKSLDQIV